MDEKDIKTYNVYRRDYVLFEIKDIIFKDPSILIYLLNHYTISEDLITRCVSSCPDSGANYLYWDAISEHKGLSETFIRLCKDYINWKIISAYQILSEDFIREFQDKVNWHLISTYQNLSKEFIEEFKNKLNQEVTNMDL